MSRPQAAPPEAQLPPAVRDAARALARGEPILVFDQAGREEETDLLVAAEHVTPRTVRRFRQDGGGLVFVALDATLAAHWRLPFAQEVQQAAAHRYPLLAELTPDRLPYDERSSFSLWVNHRDTYTGITDRDRARTICGLAELARARTPDEDGGTTFARAYRAPGHVPICVAQPEGLRARQGHTELAVALAHIAGTIPILAGCEILQPDGDAALARADAEKYALRNGLVFLDGTLLVEATEQWRPKATQDA